MGSNVRFLQVIYLCIREYIMIVSTGTSMYHYPFNDIYYLKCLGLNVCLCKTTLTNLRKNK